jgi:TatD DNase family protein
MRYFDAHCHIQFDQFERDQGDLIDRMRADEVAGIVVGVDYPSSQKAVALAGMHDHLYAAVGLHPNLESKEWFEAEKYRALAADPKVVAIGECGLDFYRPEQLDEEVKRGQRMILNDQLALAAELDKPLIIHARPSKGTQDAYHDLIGILTEAKKANPRLKGDIHFFVGGVAEAEALFALGFTVSFTAVITFARDYDAVIRSAPLDKLLSETDAPYVAPASRRGERNDPLAVEDVVAKIADVRAEPLETVRQALVENAKRLFGV